MYVNDFETALAGFDAILDALAKANKANREVCTCKCHCSDDCSDEYKSTAPCSIDFADITKDIKQVIFNDPATIVTFNDGSKVCVKACANDKFSKELGLVYAIIKRIYADDVDESGYFKASGLGEKLNKIIANAIDQKVIEAEAKAKKEAKKAAKKAAK